MAGAVGSRAALGQEARDRRLDVGRQEDRDVRIAIESCARAGDVELVARAHEDAAREVVGPELFEPSRVGALRTEESLRIITRIVDAQRQAKGIVIHGDDAAAVGPPAVADAVADFIPLSFLPARPLDRADHQARRAILDQHERGGLSCDFHVFAIYVEPAHDHLLVEVNNDCWL